MLTLYNRVIPLFPELDRQLISLLSSLTEEQWHLPTVAKQWRVKDVAAHLLDGNIRTLSASKHGYAGDPPGELHNYRDLVAYLNRLNADWVTAMKRVSPQMLCLLLKLTGLLYREYISSLDPLMPAQYAVAWAGETESLNSFHVAREYTEKWIHQQQIRHAIGDNTLLAEKYFAPLIDTFFTALPYHYRALQPESPRSVQIIITAEKHLARYLNYTEGKWSVSDSAAASFSAEIEIPAGIAWQLFSKSLTPQEAEALVKCSGDTTLARHLLALVSVMA